MAHTIMVLDPLHRKMHLYCSREDIPSFIDLYNVVIFLGCQRSNPWIQLIEDRLNFRV
jgi:hypothetical protein